MRRGWETVRGFPPRGWLDAALQFGLFFAVYNLYQLVRGFADGRADIAFANADRVIDLERTLGLFFEPGFQDAVLNQQWLIDFANFMYLNSHFVVTTGFLAWLYLFRNEHFYFVRNMFMVAMLLALVGYAAFPTAPPRLIPGEGFTDTIAVFTGVPQDGATASALVNKWAAVPSMHIGFSTMIAVPGFVLSRNPVAKAWWAVYPLIVLFVIIATGNHFWFDAFAGAFVAGSAALAATQLARVRPSHWSWRTAPAQAAA